MTGKTIENSKLRIENLFLTNQTSTRRRHSPRRNPPALDPPLHRPRPAPPRQIRDAPAHPPTCPAWRPSGVRLPPWPAKPPTRPHGPPAPTGSILLNPINHGIGNLRFPKRHKHLVQDDVIEDFVTGIGETCGETTRMATASLDHITNSATTQVLERRPDIHPPSPPRQFRSGVGREAMIGRRR